MATAFRSWGLNRPPDGIKPNSGQFTERLIALWLSSIWAPNGPTVRAFGAPRVGGARFVMEPLPLDEHPAAATPSNSDAENRNRVLIYICLRV